MLQSTGFHELGQMVTRHLWARGPQASPCTCNTCGPRRTEWAVFSISFGEWERDLCWKAGSTPALLTRCVNTILHEQRGLAFSDGWHEDFCNTRVPTVVCRLRWARHSLWVGFAQSSPLWRKPRCLPEWTQRRAGGACQSHSASFPRVVSQFSVSFLFVSWFETHSALQVAEWLNTLCPQPARQCTFHQGSVHCLTSRWGVWP